MTRLPPFLRPVFAALLVASAGDPGGAQISNADLKRQTVMILTTPKAGTPETGSGLILCQEGNRAYVLTARHVLYGKGRDGRPARRTLGSLESVKIEFFQGSPDPIVWNPKQNPELLQVRQADPKDLDLLLLEIRLDPALSERVHLGREPSVADLKEGPAPNVTAVGWLADGGEPWTDRSGVVVARDADYLYHSAALTTGFSGGPLFDAAGALIGVNVELAPSLEVPGLADENGELAATYGRAIAIERAEATIYTWTPQGCWGSASESANAAYTRYRKAMRAISLKRWRQAEVLLREAIQLKSVEGGSVHLNGMRYTEYLPHYHLGLALYKTAPRGRQCQGALTEWYRSESHGVIQGNRRYRDMRQLRKRCTDQLKAKLKANLKPAAPKPGA